MDVSKKLALDVLNESLKTGADFSELYVQNKLKHVISLSHRKVETDSSELIYGASIRLIQGNKVVFGYSSDLSRKSLMELAGKLSASFHGKQKVKVSHLKKIYNPM